LRQAPHTHTPPNSAPSAGAADGASGDYEPPKLTTLGTLAELTHGGSYTFGDGAGLQDAGGSGGI